MPIHIRISQDVIRWLFHACSMGETSQDTPKNPLNIQKSKQKRRADFRQDPADSETCPNFLCCHETPSLKKITHLTEEEDLPRSFPRASIRSEQSVKTSELLVSN